MYIRNVADVDNYLIRKASEDDDKMDFSWAIRNRDVVVRSAITLYVQLHPYLPKSLGQILGTVSMWAFQPEGCDIATSGLWAEETSLARVEPNESFLVIRTAQEGGEHIEDSDSSEDEIGGIEVPPRIACNVFCGHTYRLEIRH